jgi:lipoprotein-anchoring transpeptidase ErfK/SrfK
LSRVPRKAKVALILSFAVVLVGGSTGVGYAAYQHDAALHGRLPAGSVVGGVAVAGLTREAALARVKATVERDWDRRATVTVAGHTYVTTLRRLGVRHDADAAVTKAFETAMHGNWVTRAWHKLVDGSAAPHEDVSVTTYDTKRLTRLAARAAAEVGVAAVNADVQQAGGWLTFSKSKTGWALDTKAFVTALQASLADGTPRDVPLTEVAPKTAAVDTAVLVRTGENKLYLYQHGKITKTFGVATGSPIYPTPLGRFEVTLKRYLPTWVNPWSKWSMDEPAQIGPGPNNPLGTRAMNLSAPGIRIHGTPSWNSIGYSVSHGCIRMRMPDVEALYPLVPQGAPVFIVKAGPPRLPGSPAPATDAANAADGG